MIEELLKHAQAKGYISERKKIVPGRMKWSYRARDIHKQDYDFSDPGTYVFSFDNISHMFQIHATFSSTVVRDENNSLLYDHTIKNNSTFLEIKDHLSPQAEEKYKNINQEKLIKRFSEMVEIVDEQGKRGRTLKKSQNYHYSYIYNYNNPGKPYWSISHKNYPNFNFAVYPGEGFNTIYKKYVRADAYIAYRNIAYQRGEDYMETKQRLGIFLHQTVNNDKILEYISLCQEMLAIAEKEEKDRTKKCKVSECTNRKHQGNFIDSYCAPCYSDKIRS